MDDIVFAYKKNKKDEVMWIQKLLEQKLTIKEVGELKWFLGLHIVCNQSKRTM